jgi:hypothetical protein
MNVVVGIIILIVALGALYYMNQAGLFKPLTELISQINSGYGSAYGESGGTPANSTRYHEARIRFVSLGGTINAPKEVDIVAHPKGVGMDVTGWKLATKNGTYVIPKVQNLYSPSTATAAPEDIFMRDGDKLALYSGVSPTKRDERVTQGDYHVWLGDFLPSPHGKIILLDASNTLVDQYAY